jgi:hypothetical protein
MGFKKTSLDLHSFDYIKYPDPECKENYEDIRIPRLRFKPGYQRLWRYYRAALADAIRFKYIYQQQLTKYLLKFYRSVKFYNIMTHEYKAWKIILYSKLLPDITSINDFIDNKLVYINGNTLNIPDRIILVNEIVQLVVSPWYYIYNRWLLSWNNIRVNKFKKLVYRKKIASTYKIMKSLKQKSSYTPLYIYNMRYDMSETKSYLEVDYFTLSFIMIYDNFTLDFHTSNEFTEMKHFVYRMYNWKYVN